MSELILAGHGVSMQFASHWLLHYTKDVKMLQNVDSFTVIKIRRTLTIHAIGRISTPGAFTGMRSHAYRISHYSFDSQSVSCNLHNCALHSAVITETPESQ